MPARPATLALAPLLATALCACSLYQPLPEPLSSEEVQAIVDEERRLYWDHIAPGEPFPDVDIVQTVDADTGWTFAVACVEEQNIPGVTISGGGIATDGGAVAQEVERAIFLCNSAYPVDYSSPSDLGYFSRAQLEYLWTYFASYLVPCLRAHGWDPGELPAQGSFVNAPYITWSPYSELARQPVSAHEWRGMDLECAPPPIGDLWRPTAPS
ncbi:MAG: hypothetical protein U1E32_09830 [Rhodoglobus sp.]|nr:hypothetical protein [Rhodoglobus sp.]